MAHIEKRTGRGKPWRVRYRAPSGRERSRSFARKADAEKFKSTTEADLVRGEWHDPRLARATVAGWSERWLRTKAHLKPYTRAGYESLLRVHIVPRWGDLELRHIDRLGVEEWVADLQATGLSASRVRQARQVLNSMMKLAVETGYLTVNPVEGASVPRQPEGETRFLSVAEVERLAEAIRSPYEVLVYTLAYGGLRWGEAAALRRQRCDLLRSRLEVTESLSEAWGGLQFGSTKTHRRRTVMIPGFLRDLLASHLATEVEDDPAALVFTSYEGGPLRNSNFRRRIWNGAVAEAGLVPGLRIHDLRHTCASLLIAEGAHPRAVMGHLGHSSITVTMDRYGHLFPSDMEALAEALGAARGRALAAQPRPSRGPRVVELRGDRQKTQ
ncbi:MAG: tyrosine-type recombinase/integrase [Gammaproteobacteria bacterium]|nr:tyrosine-type recombinase/integrase [Gammaproteobacteria bacterium]